MLGVPRDVEYVIWTLIREGYDTYLVGGCVRDFVMGVQPRDYDICTTAPTDMVNKLFKRVTPIGGKHGTVTIITDTEKIEVTSLNVVGDVNRAIYADLCTRDFTMNAMAMDVSGEIWDPLRGRDDIENKLIKAVGSPYDRFNEDALRMLRAIRFSCSLQFGIDKVTLNGVEECSRLIKTVSIERVREELNKILLADCPAYGFNLLYMHSLLQYIIPELCICVGFDQNNIYHDKDIFDHTMVVLESVPAELDLRLAALLHDIAKPQTFNGGHFYGHHIEGADMACKILGRMKYSNAIINTVEKLVLYHMDRYSHKLSKAAVKRFINRVGEENLDKLFELQIADIKGCKVPHDFSGVLNMRDYAIEVLNSKEPLGVKDLDIDGYDLMEIGVGQGKKMGEILRSLTEEVLENEELNQKNKLIDIVKRTYLD